MTTQAVHEKMIHSMRDTSWRRKTTATVVYWFRRNGRHYPWRTSTDPFHVLLAEILLRRTQADRVVPTYLELTHRFPSPMAMARANPQSLRRLLQPLGLVRRADCIIETSRLLVRQHAGRVPRNLEALLQLPGVGAYSARAVLCTAFNDPVPMVDESSGRLMRRLMDLPGRGAAYADHRLRRAAEEFLPKHRSKEFNLGILDIAAAFCRPTKPLCKACPVAHLCEHSSRLSMAT
ncbi:A/G-specific adenine glycosylase [Limnochorda pilosa]|uniref:A/G-specific adenine glycosylase n=1 Tax=Limnochorda pilosa TaxID=1555112 RepID=UPI0011875858